MFRRDALHSGHLLVLITVGGFALDIASFLGWVRPAIGAVALLVVSGGVMIAAFRDLRWGIAAFLLELLWGSHGRLLLVHVFGQTITLRMAIMLVVIIATAWHLRRQTSRDVLVSRLRTHPVRWVGGAFLVTIVLAATIGFVRHAYSSWYPDANAWGLLLLLPALLLVPTEELLTIARTTLRYGMPYLTLRASALLFLASHAVGEVWSVVYLWIRDVRLGEVTLTATRIPRVFLPSMVLAIPVALLAITWCRRRQATPAERRSALWMLTASTILLLMSMSRSFWLALAVLGGGGLVVTGWRYVRGRTGNLVWTSWWRPGVAVLGGTLLLAGILVFPVPPSLVRGGLSDAVAARFSTDAAVANRWQEIGPLGAAIRLHPILGSGFGATVTYDSRDPRALAAFPDGRYTTTAFEWGYLDDLLERGAIGLLIELGLIAALVVASMRKGGDVAVLGCGLLAIAIVHATSPYLNHPLGLGMVLLVFALTASTPKSVTATR